jgi:NHLM bacteriocin system ABC transporter ATP-binding protein
MALTPVRLGPAPLRLDQPDGWWLVVDGEVAVFAAPLQADGTTGPRRFVGSVPAGGVLGGATPKPGTDWILLGVAVGETDVQAIDPVAWMAGSPVETVQPALALWLRALAQTVPPAGTVTPWEVGPGGHLSLATGEVLQARPDSLAWVTTTGRLCWLGRPAAGLDGTGGPIPLAGGLWLQAADEQTVSALELPPDPAACLAGLHTLIHQLLEAVGEWTATEEAAAFDRFLAREQQRTQVTEAAFQDMASVLGRQRQPVPPEGGPWLQAARVVGDRLGVPVKPPGHWEDGRRQRDPYEAIARASRLRLRQVLLRGDWYRRDAGPLLAYLEEGRRPVALLPEPRGGYVLHDPAGGQRLRVQADVARTLLPTAYMLYRPLPWRKLNAWDLVRFGLQPARRDILIILAASLATTLIGMVVPQAMGLLIDQALPDADQGLLWQIGLALLASSIGALLFHLTEGLALLRAETLAETTTEAAVWDRLLRLKVPFFRQYSSGDLESRLSAIGEIRQRLSGTTLHTLLAAAFAVLNFILLVGYSPAMSLVALGIGLVSVAVTAGFSAFMLRYHRRLRELEGDLHGLVVQLIAGVSKLRVAGAEERGFAHWARRYTEQQQTCYTIQRLNDNLGLYDEILPAVTSILLFSAAVSQVSGGMSTGTFLAFSTAFGAFIGGIASLGHTLDTLIDVVSLWERAKPILEAEPEVDDAKTDPGPLSGRIELDHVTFRYRPDGPFILRDLSLRIRPGEYVAIVGPSGSGKSTLLRLLLGFEGPEFGKVAYDGQDLATLDLPSVRRQCGVVLQHSRIMAGSLFDNIAGGLVISIDDAWAAARLAGLADDVAAMPMGMHTVISEGGTTLSGGQRQRLLIARALALKPAIVLFDEATSALDNRTQAIVSESLERMRVTRLVIAHRLSTVRHADRIVVLEAGQVTQSGSFAELMAQPEGLFARMMGRQMT